MQLPSQKPFTWASPQLLLMPADTVRRPAGGEWDFLPNVERVCTVPLPARATVSFLAADRGLRGASAPRLPPYLNSQA